ncbi:IS5/IS1182 family transposase, partial [Actinoplanes sp. NPDC051411]
MATLAVTRRPDLTDRQWVVLAPLRSAPSTGRPPKWEKRQVIDGIRWQAHGDAQGRIDWTVSVDS